MDVLFNELSPAQQEILLQGPSLQPPHNVTPNFIDPANSNRDGYAAVTTCIAISTLVFVLRMYAKGLIARKLAVEDYVFIAAFGVYIGWMYESYEFLQYPGAYVHQWDIQLRHLHRALYTVNIGTILYGNVIMLLKAGITLEWVHVFVPSGIRSPFFWTCHAIIWLNILFYSACTLVEIFQCTPRTKIWNPLVLGSCVNNHTVIITSSAINLVSDIILLILPQKVIWNLRISMRKKFGISVIFAVGIFGCICGTLRLFYSVQFSRSPDAIYHITPLSLWCQGEMASGFVIFSMPSLPKVFRQNQLIQRAMNLLKSWNGYSRNTEKQKSKRELPSWFRPQSWRRPGGVQTDSELSELDTRDLINTRSTSKISATSLRLRDDESANAHHVIGTRPKSTANHVFSNSEIAGSV